MTKPQTDLEELKELAEIGRAHGEAYGRRTEVNVDGSVTLTPDQLQARKRRNLWIALSIAAFVVLVFLVTMVKVQDGIVAGAS